jgi:serine phosphatase RsbU (regulator of sigma subunit)
MAETEKLGSVTFSDEATRAAFLGVASHDPGTTVTAKDGCRKRSLWWMKAMQNDSIVPPNGHVLHKRLDQELAQAREVQQRLFPLTLDVDQRLDNFAINLPMDGVSGDGFDLFKTGPDTVAFVLADVAGHGMPAAVMWSDVRARVTTGLSMGLSWHALFREIDEAITRAWVDTLVTGIVGEVDLAANELRLVSAGHPLPSILVGGGRPALLPYTCQTRPWGLVDFEVPWEVGRIALPGKWSALLFTDGVSDAWRANFGSRRLADYHLEHWHRNAKDICQGILRQIAPLRDEGSPTDDRTVMVVKKR